MFGGFAPGRGSPSPVFKRSRRERFRIFEGVGGIASVSSILRTNGTDYAAIVDYSADNAGASDWSSNVSGGETLGTQGAGAVVTASVPADHGDNHSCG